MDISTRSSTRSTPLRRSVTPSTHTAASSTIETPSSLSSAFLHTPGTSTNSSVLEPRSEYLRDILKDRYASTAAVPPHLSFMGRPTVTPPSTSSKRPLTHTKGGVPTSMTPSSVVDAWMLASTDSPLPASSRSVVKSNESTFIMSDRFSESTRTSASTAAATNRHSRRSNSIAAGVASTTPARALGVRETEVLLDRQSKENFDLKLRLCLQEERIAKLSTELEGALSQVSETDRLRANLHETEDARSDLVENIHMMETEIDGYKAENDKLNAEKDEAHRLHEELVSELEKRDTAVNEAVNMIMSLQNELEHLRRLYNVSQASIGSDRNEYSQQPSLYVSPGDGYDGRNASQFENPSRPQSRHTLVRSSASLRSSRDRLSLPGHMGPVSPSPHLLSVQANYTSRPSTGAAESEYYSAQSSFSPTSSSSVILDSGASRQRHVVPSHHAPRHPQISRIQTAANPSVRLQTLPESRTVSNGSSQFNRESPNSAPLTCESRDSVETIDSLTSASSASMAGKRDDDHRSRRRSLNAPAVPSHLRQCRPAQPSKGHSRSRSANEMPSFGLPTDSHMRPELYGQGVSTHQVPMSAVTATGRFPEQSNYHRPQNFHRSQTSTSTPTQATFSSQQSTAPRSRPIRPVHVSHERDYFEPELHSAPPADWDNQRRHQRMSSSSHYTPPHPRPSTGSPAPEPSTTDYSLHRDMDHGVPVRPGTDYSDAFEVASTVATHEDMAYDSSSSRLKFDGPGFDVSSSEDEGEVSLVNAHMLPGQMTHGVQLRPAHNPTVPLRNQRPPEPPERRSSNRASFTGFFDVKKEEKEAVRHDSGRSHHVQFVSPDMFSQSLPIAADRRSSIKADALLTKTSTPAPIKSRARRLTDDPVGFLSFGKFGRKG